jgi:Terpene synthase family 2, C-terminal metal binding
MPSTVHPAERRVPSLPPVYCPFPSAINPRADEIEELCVQWIDRHALYRDRSERERLIATRAAEVYSRALPSAEPERVAAVAKWLYWGFATDDLYYDNGPTSASASAFLILAAPLVRLSEEPRAGFTWDPPYADALRDLVRGVYSIATPAQALDWANTARAWFFGMAWDVANAERGVPPSLNDYLMMRMHTGGLASWATTLNIANGIQLSAEQANDPAVRAMTEAWSTFALLLNDFMSFAKEAKLGDNSSNIIRVIAHEDGCDEQEAVIRAYRVCDRIASLFVALRGQLLVDADRPLRRYIAGLEHTWRGIIEWGFSCPRYRQGGDPNGEVLQEFPGWADAPSEASLEPLGTPSVAWWWDELRGRGGVA